MIYRTYEGMTAKTIGADGGVISVDDPNNELYGVSLTVPPGARSEDMLIALVRDPFSEPLLPQQYIALSSHFTIIAADYNFQKPTKVTVTIAPSSLPAGARMRDIILIGLGDCVAWIKLEDIRHTDTTVSGTFTGAPFYQFAAVYDKPAE